MIASMPQDCFATAGTITPPARQGQALTLGFIRLRLFS
jgi:hypothetical protein